MEPATKIWVWIATAVAGGTLVAAIIYTLGAVFTKKAERTPEEVKIDRQQQPQAWWQWLLAIGFITGIVICAALRS